MARIDRVFSDLFAWLDASSAHYWFVAWSTFGLAAALSITIACTGREKGWWQHPIVFSALLLIVLVAFRWPAVLDNRHYFDPDESQLIAGASTLRYDPVFWRSVDGTTHGPFAQLPILLGLVVRQSVDFTTARMVSVFLVWIELVGAWLLFRHLYKNVGALLVLPLLAVHAFTHEWAFVAYSTEHSANALVALACCLLLIAWRRNGHGTPRLVLLFGAGVLFGAVPFAKLQAAPVAAVALAGGALLALLRDNAGWRERLRALGALIAGAAMVPAIIVTVVLIGGIWPDFFHSYLLDNIRYTGANRFWPQRTFTWLEGPRVFFYLGWDAVGFHPFFLWVVGLSGCGLGALPWFAKGSRRCVIFATAVLLAAIFAAMAPGRAYVHYLQLVTFPAGLFGGVLVGALANDLGARSRLVQVALLSAFVLGGLLPQIWWRVSTPQPFIGRFTATRGALARSSVSNEILQHATPGERLGMWGWMPVFWVETGLIQATRDGNDSRQIEPHDGRDYYRARFLRDFLRTRPPVFVDAVGTGNFLYEDRAKYGYETFPELRDYVSSEYHLVADVTGTRIYVRNNRQ